MIAGGVRLAIGRLCRDRRGGPALEFALIAPTLLLLILGGMEFSRFLWTESALQLSVEQAARCYAWEVSTCTSSSGVQAYAATVAPQLNFSSSVFKATSCDGGAGAEVTASYQYSFIAKGLFPFTPTLSASACFPIVSPTV
jgi:Flp pilus assembly protein TadG